MKQEFWLSNILVLLDKDYIMDLFPKKEYNLERKMNSLTRIVLLMTILGYLLTRSLKIIISGIVTLIIIVVLYYSEERKERKLTKDNIKDVIRQEGFTNPKVYEMTKTNFTEPTNKNPMMNVNLTEINENPNRKIAAPSYNVAVEKDINDKVKQGLDKKLFKDLGDDMHFEQSMRNFYTNPSTTVPNDQDKFMKFCYGGMLSRKEGDIY